MISVSCKPLHVSTDEQRREWITYRRYSEFNDLHMTIRKRYPALKEFIHLPNKSFMNNTSPEVRIKRQKELNDYLVVSDFLKISSYFIDIFFYIDISKTESSSE